MENFGSECNQGVGIGKDAEVRLADSAAIFLRAIENAGGVPFRLVFEPEKETVCYCDAGEGIIGLLGVTRKEFTLKSFLSMIEELLPVSGEAETDLSQVHGKILSGETGSYKAEIRVRTGGGETKWIQYALVSQTDEEAGKVTGAFGIMTDITAERLNDERIKMKEEEFDRLKTDLVHNISHEIRTPLNAIVGFSTLLGEHGDIPERRKEYLEIIIRNSDHLIEIIDDITEISKIDAGMIRLRKDKVNLNEVLRKVYDQFWPDAFKKGILLSFEPEQDKGDEIYTDWYKINEVLRNLVENALKFTFEGRVEFGYSINDRKVEFCVSDTGIGIPAEQQPKIFSRFFQVDTSATRIYGGTGMSLSITKAYIELLGGKIWFTSQQGEGSVFRFTIPYEKVEKNGANLKIVI
jgi:signal transduction histidine kinase